jgi:hypothetical protein
MTPPACSRPLALVVTLLVLSASALPRSAGAQQPASIGQDTTTTVMSATLLRRLAEAVDAQRNNRPVWVVIQRQFPHDVKGVYYGKPQASGVAEHLAGYAVLGPFVTPPDSGTQTTMFTMDPCPGKHDSFSHCPDSTRFNGAAIAAMASQDVDSLVVTIYGRRGEPIRRKFAVDEVDALFFTLSAIDKFAMPYYSWLYGPEIAGQMRRNYVRQLGRASTR